MKIQENPPSGNGAIQRRRAGRNAIVNTGISLLAIRNFAKAAKIPCFLHEIT
jgi:hypothetical protein